MRVKSFQALLFLSSLYLVSCVGPEKKETKSFYDSGELRSVTVRTGPNEFKEKEYSESGVLMHEGGYRIENADTALVWGNKYNDDGGLYYAFTPDQTTIYYDNGAVRYRVENKDGMRHGVAESFSESGQVMSRVSYSNDRKDGDYLIFHDNGKLKIRELYKNGQQLSPSIEFDENGIVRKKRYSENNETVKVELLDAKGNLEEVIEGREALLQRGEYRSFPTFK